jgi:hypothetical protein
MIYSEELIASWCDTILSEIEGGKSVKEILEQDGYPARATFYGWLNKSPELVERYKRATEVRADNIFDEMLAIADDKTDDYYYDKNGDKQFSMNSVNRTRVRLDTRKWVLGKMTPTKYSDKIDITSNGKEIKAIPIVGMQILNTEPDADSE